jgi:hypothetical protein
MKKIAIYIIAIIFMFSGITIADQRGNRDNNQRGWNKKKQRTTQHYKRSQRSTRQYKRSHTYKRNRSHYGHGYRDRHYGHRSYIPRHYRGHWRSWDTWYLYYLLNQHEWRSHRYYRDSNGSLYFEFQDNTGTFAFSIGR